MQSAFRPEPREFRRNVKFLCGKLDKIAEEAGLSPADCNGVNGTLAALPPAARDRLKLMLKDVLTKTESEHPAMAFAARYMLKLAEEIWAGPPVPSTQAAPRLSRDLHE